MTTGTLSMLDAAVLYAEHGLHVIPVWRSDGATCPCPRGERCISPGKHPVIDSWQTAATTELTVLRDWFADQRHNLGVVCGTSKICVIDIDPRNGGMETFAALQAELGELPATVSADSGGGGKHYVFQRPDGDLVSKLGAGVDLLHGSRQFLVEPSIHQSGKMYRWQPSRGPDEIGVATLPEAWVRKARRASPARFKTAPTLPPDLKIERARRYIARIPGAISGAGGHTATFNAVAHVMIGFDLDPDTTLSIVASDFNPRCDPPWSERELLHKIRSVAERCERPRGYLLEADRRPVHTTQQAASRPTVTSTTDDASIPWASRLLVNEKSGKAKRGYHNVMTFVRWFPDYVGKWSLNTMTGDVWFDGEPMPDTFVNDIRAKMDERLGVSPGRDDVDAAILSAASERTFHPIQQYLRSVDWDGKHRLSEMARDYLASDAPLHAELVRKWMISAVARALRPGCKVDTALMLYGEQGYFKSSFFAVLGGSWHADSPIDISNKDSFQQIHAAWIYEFAELENVVTGRAESRLKAWLTSTHDMFRAPYARSVANRARSCVICGTTNRKHFLTDDTGSRRFLIVPVAKPIDIEELARARDQLWAEAVCAYEAGEAWWLAREVDAEREEANVEFTSGDDPWLEKIASWLTSTMSETSMSAVLSDALRIETARQDRAAEMRVGKIMKQLGWLKVRVRTGLTLRWAYRRAA